MPVADHWAMLLLGYAIVASGPLSWGTGADYARYLPQDTSKRAVAWWTALGGFVPAVLIGTLGVVAATAIDMTDPQLTIGEIVPAWFTPIFLAIVVLGSITNNVLVAYSTGLYAQGLGIRVSRAATVVITGAVATVLAGWFVFLAPSFLDTLNASLELSVTVLGPLVAVYAVDILAAPQPLRRRRPQRRAPHEPVLVLGRLVLAGHDRDGRRHHDRRAHGEHDPLRRPDRDWRSAAPTSRRSPVRSSAVRSTPCSGSPRARTATRRGGPRHPTAPADHDRDPTMMRSRRMPRHPPPATWRCPHDLAHAR